MGRHRQLRTSYTHRDIFIIVVLFIVFKFIVWLSRRSLFIVAIRGMLHEVGCSFSEIIHAFCAPGQLVCWW